jgi:hypothetical protein
VTSVAAASLSISIATEDIVNLSCFEQNGHETEAAGHTAVTASFQWFAASALKIRSVGREMRWR